MNNRRHVSLREKNTFTTFFKLVLLSRYTIIFLAIKFGNVESYCTHLSFILKVAMSLRLHSSFFPHLDI